MTEKKFAKRESKKLKEKVQRFRRISEKQGPLPALRLLTKKMCKRSGFDLFTIVLAIIQRFSFLRRTEKNKINTKNRIQRIKSTHPNSGLSENLRCQNPLGKL